MSGLRLRDFPDDLGALVSRTAEHLGIPPDFVEKDFWVTEVLRSTVSPRTLVDKAEQERSVKVVFKGGTSLSRIYGIIERFSEDVDVLVVFPANCSIRAKDKLLKSICADVGAHLGLASDSCVHAGSKTGVKRNMRFLYERPSSSLETTEGVLLEMGSRGGDFPVETAQLQSMIAQYAVDELAEREDSWAEFAPVTLNVLAPERTLLEKLAALHDAGSRLPDLSAENRLRVAGRHVYDIHRLLNDTRVLNALSALGPTGVEELCTDIDINSESAGFPFTPRPSGGYASSPAFNETGESQNVLGEAYETAAGLIYGHRPTLAECLQTIRSSPV